MMTSRRFHFCRLARLGWALLITLLLFIRLGSAEQNEQERRLAHIHSFAAKMPKEWFSCNASKDCGLVWYNCMAEALAANAHHLKDAQGVICQTELCSWLQCPKGGLYFAECDQGQCQTKVGIDPSIACRQDSDCQIIPYDCNQATMANINHMDEVKERLCKDNDCSMSNCDGFNPHEYKPRCMYGGCVVQWLSDGKGPQPDPGGEKWNKRFMAPKQSSQ
jgi:hypothetical protein